MFDPATFDWGGFALAASAVLVLVWAAALWRRRPSFGAACVSFALLLTACMTTAAPFRGLLDPNYVGYSFGLLHAARGWSVTLAAGSVLALGLAAAFLLLRQGRGATIFAGAVGLYFLLCLAPPVLTTLFTDPTAFEIQFGEYLTVPGNIAVVPVLAVLTGYATAAIWGAAALLRIDRSARA